MYRLAYDLGYRLTLSDMSFSALIAALDDGPYVACAAEEINEEVEPVNEEVRAPYVEIIGGSVNVRSGPSANSPYLFPAHRGDTFPCGETDADTGWYGIETDKARRSCRAGQI